MKSATLSWSSVTIRVSSATDEVIRPISSVELLTAMWQGRAPRGCARIVDKLSPPWEECGRTLPEPPSRALAGARRVGSADVLNRCAVVQSLKPSRPSRLNFSRWFRMS